jgi:hypothetical protein
MKTILAYFILFSAFSIEAHEHRHHGAHAHGAGKLGIAFEGANGKIDFKIPSESIFGFEHDAKTKKQKAAKKAGISVLEQKPGSLVIFDPALQCVITANKVEVVKEKRGSHSDTVAEYTVKCVKSPAGTAITFNFHSEFPRIKEIDVEIVADSFQKAGEVKTSGTRLELK